MTNRIHMIHLLLAIGSDCVSLPKKNHFCFSTFTPVPQPQTTSDAILGPNATRDRLLRESHAPRSSLAPLHTAWYRVTRPAGACFLFCNIFTLCVDEPRIRENNGWRASCKPRAGYVVGQDLQGWLVLWDK